MSNCQQFYFSIHRETAFFSQKIGENRRKSAKIGKNRRKSAKIGEYM
jgi:hypothetical protein